MDKQLEKPASEISDIDIVTADSRVLKCQVISFHNA